MCMFLLIFKTIYILYIAIAFCFWGNKRFAILGQQSEEVLEKFTARTGSFVRLNVNGSTSNFNSNARVIDTTMNTNSSTFAMRPTSFVIDVLNNKEGIRARSPRMTTSPIIGKLLLEATI